MTPLDSTPLILALALAIDRLVGDPAWLWRRVPHPIVLMGHLINWLDQLAHPVVEQAAPLGQKS